MGRSHLIGRLCDRLTDGTRRYNCDIDGQVGRIPSDTYMVKLQCKL